jgi:protein-S-isoprenylcysteine O-methyltransferase Ste14
LPYVEKDHGWGYWFGSATGLGSVWAALILAVLAAHVWGTVIFGIRFSNLTNRGIITNGPYRWSKHPAYITKMIMYAMIWFPFVNAASWHGAMRNSLAFGCLCTIYYLRAKAEEGYLMEDPDYRSYANYISRYGLIATMRCRLLTIWRKTVSTVA